MLCCFLEPEDDEKKRGYKETPNDNDILFFRGGCDVFSQTNYQIHNLVCEFLVERRVWNLIVESMKNNILSRYIKTICIVGRSEEDCYIDQKELYDNVYEIKNKEMQNMEEECDRNINRGWYYCERFTDNNNLEQININLSVLFNCIFVSEEDKVDFETKTYK